MFKDEFNKIERTSFTYKEFKFFFDEILDNVYRLKSKKLFLSSSDNVELDLLMDKAIEYKDLFFSFNKRNYFEKAKITVHMFLLKLEINSIYLYD